MSVPVPTVICHHDHDRNDNGLNILASTIAELHSSDQHISLSQRTSDIGEKVLAAVGDSGRHAVGATTEAARAVTQSVNAAEIQNLQTIADSTLQTIAAIDRAQVNIRDAVCHAESINLDATRQVNKDLERVGGDVKLAICKDVSDLRRELAFTNNDITKQIAGLDRDLLLTQKQSALELCQATKVLERQAADNMHQLTLESQNVRHGLSRQMDECCCSLKEKIESRFCDTKELIREIDANRLRDQLADAKLDNLFLRSRSNHHCTVNPSNGGGVTVGIGAGIGVGGSGTGTGVTL